MLKKLLTKVIIFQILVLISLGCLLYYLYKVRVVEKVNYTDVRQDIVDNTISKVKAESLTLDSLIQKKENPNFKQSYYINSVDQLEAASTNIQQQYKIDGNTITKADNIIAGAIPSFYTVTDSATLDDQTIVDLITSAIQKDSLTEIDIDVTITNKVTNIETVIRNITSKISPNNIKIDLGLPLKWSDVFDYSYLDTVSNFYKSNASITILNNLCNKFRIAAYGYTTLYSSNAGPITKPEIAQDTIKYYIYKGLSSNKIDLVINNTGYMWGNRSYTDNYLYNFVLSTQQVVVISNQDLNSFLTQSGFKILQNFDDGENLGVLQNNGNINYIVYPRLTQLSTLVDIAKSYGLNGFIYKNF